MGGKAHHDRKLMENFLDLIEVMKDPEKYAEAVAELDERLAKVTAMVELVGPAEDIEKIRSQCLVDKSTALKLIDDAKAKAKVILSKVKELIEVKEADIENRLGKVADKEGSLVRRIAEEGIKFEAADKVLKLREEKSEQQYIQGDKMLQEGRSLKKDFEGRLQKLREAAE